MAGFLDFLGPITQIGMGLFNANRDRQAADKAHQDTVNANKAAAAATDLAYQRSLDVAATDRANQKYDASQTFIDLRDAAVAGGINPLTALMATGGSQFGSYGTTAATPGAAYTFAQNAPPLASTQMLASGLGGLADVFSGKADMQHAQDKLSLDLGKLQLEKLQFDIAHPQPAFSTGAGRSALGVEPQGMTSFDDMSGNPHPVLKGDPFTVFFQAAQAEVGQGQDIINRAAKSTHDWLFGADHPNAYLGDGTLKGTQSWWDAAPAVPLSSVTKPSTSQWGHF